MKHVSAGLAGLLALGTSSAIAADVVEYTPPPAAIYTPVSVYDWGGGYFGIQGGFMTARERATVTIPPPIAFTGAAAGTANGGFVGGFAGYNFQWGSWVFGVEGDLNYAWVRRRGTLAGVAFTSGIDWTGSIRGRAGYAFNRFLAYATSGVVFARTFARVPGVSLSETRTGVTVGAGLEYAVLENITVRGEYRYNWFAPKTYSAAGVTVRSRVDAHQFGAGIAYKF